MYVLPGPLKTVQIRSADSLMTPNRTSEVCWYRPLCFSNFLSAAVTAIRRRHSCSVVVMTRLIVLIDELVWGTMLVCDMVSCFRSSGAYAFRFHGSFMAACVHHVKDGRFSTFVGHVSEHWYHTSRDTGRLQSDTHPLQHGGFTCN